MLTPTVYVGNVLKTPKKMQQNPNFLKNCSVGFFLTEVPVFSTLILHIGIENILVPSQDFALEAICEAKISHWSEV